MPYKIPFIMGATIASVVIIFSFGYATGKNATELKYSYQVAKQNEITQQKNVSNAKIAIDAFNQQVAIKNNYNSIIDEVNKNENTDADIIISSKWMQYVTRCAKQTSNSR